MITIIDLVFSCEVGFGKWVLDCDCVEQNFIGDDFGNDKNVKDFMTYYHCDIYSNIMRR